jgi:hypothetical protein
MADIVGSNIEVNIPFQVIAVIFSVAVKAKGCFVTLDKETGIDKCPKFPVLLFNYEFSCNIVLCLIIFN